MAVEESLYFGVPVIVTVRCGCAVIVQDGINGFVIKYADFLQELEGVLLNLNLSKLTMDVEKNGKYLKQVRGYLDD